MKFLKFYRGWIPAQAYEMLESKEIGMSEFVLLGLIVSLQKGKSSEGCWATNSYLGKRLGLSPIRVSKIIQSLKKLDLIEVKQTGVKGREKRVMISKLDVGEKDDPGSSKKTTLLASTPIREEITKKKSVFRSRSARFTTHSGEHDMPIFPELVSNHRQNNNKYLPVARKMSNRLVKTKLLLRIPGEKTLNRWANDLRLLAEAVGDIKVKNAVKWVVKNAHRMNKGHKPELPTITSPAMLRKDAVWNWVERCMQRDGPEVKVLDPDGQRILTAALRQKWPGNCKEHLPGLIARALFGIRKFDRKLQKHHDKLHRKYATKKIQVGSKMAVIWMLEKILNEVSFHEHFVRRWILDVVQPRMSKKFDNILYFEWSPTHPDFRKMGLRWVNGDAEQWDRLVEFLMES